jgi:hypothetical protein
MSMSPSDYALAITQVVQASANALGTLNEVLEQQRHHILRLTSDGNAPSLAHVPPVVAMPVRPTANTPASAASTPETTPMGEVTNAADMLALTQQMVNGLIDQAPEVALAQVYQMSAHAIGLALLNTVASQQQLHIVAQTVLAVEASHRLSPSAG